MLTYHLQRVLRNSYLTISKLIDDPYFKLFSSIYTHNSQSWPWVYRYAEHSYLIAKFLHPALSCYQGFEFAVFNGKRVACYWLPGARSQAQGHVICGDHYVKVRFGISDFVYLVLEKTEQQVFCKSVSKMPIAEKSQPVRLYSNLLNYKILHEELIELIIFWFDDRIKKFSIQPFQLESTQTKSAWFSIANQGLCLVESISKKARIFKKYLKEQD